MAHGNVTGSPETDPSREDKRASHRDEADLSSMGKGPLLTTRRVRRPPPYYPDPEDLLWGCLGPQWRNEKM